MSNTSNATQFSAFTMGIRVEGLSAEVMDVFFFHVLYRWCLPFYVSNVPLYVTTSCPIMYYYYCPICPILCYYCPTTAPSVSLLSHCMLLLPHLSHFVLLLSYYCPICLTTVPLYATTAPSVPFGVTLLSHPMFLLPCCVLLLSHCIYHRFSSTEEG